MIDGISEGPLRPTAAAPSPDAAADRLAWRQRWQAGQTGWDVGTASSGLAALVAAANAEGALPAGAAVLEPGCGRAHNGAALARLGLRVTSFDVVPEAVAGARALYADVPGLTLVEQDALVPVPAWRGTFDAVIDRAMLCALPRALRKAYVAACFAHLKADGHLLTLPFTALKISEAEGPPFQVTMLELSALLLPGFALVSAEERCLDAAEARVAAETVCVWRRRARALVESG